MDYTVTRVRAHADTGVIFEIHWDLTHTVGEFTVRRYGVVGVPAELPALLFATVTELDAIERAKEVLGEIALGALEAGVLAEIAAQQTPTTIEGTPWA